jgi:hypothetical protein
VRTGPWTFWTSSAGTAGDSAAGTLARRGVAVAWRLAIPDISLGAALTVRDSVTIGAGATLAGSDTALAIWAGQCPPPGPVAGLALPDSLRICTGGCAGGGPPGVVTGAPPVLEDAAAAAPTRYDTWGAERWATVAASAPVVLPPGAIVTAAPRVSAGRCDRTALDNWGELGGSGPCAGYAPLIHALGDVELRGGAGQGVLLAEGDVVLSGGATFAGLVIARDDVRSSGTGGTVLGAVLAADVNRGPGDHTTLGSGARVLFSRCAVLRALERSARLVPLRRRSWSALH